MPRTEQLQLSSSYNLPAGVLSRDLPFCAAVLAHQHHLLRLALALQAQPVFDHLAAVIVGARSITTDKLSLNQAQNILSLTQSQQAGLLGALQHEQVIHDASLASTAGAGFAWCWESCCKRPELVRLPAVARATRAAPYR
jgi:hypothetical protein